VRLAPWLWADADLTLSRGRFLDAPRGEDRIPLAPRVTSSGGLTARNALSSAGVRYRIVGDRPADETGAVTAQGHALLELFASRRVGALTFSAGVENLTNTRWNEAQFATTSRLRGESMGITELHYTPGAPRSFVVGVEYRP
jgi:outer membrane receptor protein involved in Fe transport